MSKQFKFGMVVDVVPLDRISKAWDYFEVPLAIHADPFKSDNAWEAVKARYRADGRPTPVTSHLLDGVNVHPIGPDFDREQLLYCLGREFRRIDELGAKYIGCWGGHFKVPEGFPKEKATDQAVSLCNMIADEAEKYGMLIAVEPISDLRTLFPRYLEGIEFAKRCGRRSLKVMADLNYFLELGQPLEDILKYPDFCLNVHIQGDGGSQPNVGGREKTFIRLFEILREIGYDKGVSAGCPWISTNGAAEIDYKYETDKTLAYLQDLRDRVYK